MGNIKTALIDGDILLFRCGKACEHKEYIVYAKGLEDEGPMVDYPYKADVKTWMAEHGYTDDDVTIDIRTIVEPKHFAFHLVKQTLKKILDRTGASTYRIFLTHGVTYRKLLVPDYKAQRKDEDRPFWEQEIRDYLVERWGAKVVDWYEADDAMAIMQMNNRNTCICTIDKDLKMVPGLHYNWVDDVDMEKPAPIVRIGEPEATRFFYKQMIIGDRTDNVMGIPQKGPAAADALLDGVNNPTEMYRLVREEYIKYFKEEADAMIARNATALWMLRDRDAYWMPPEVSND